MALHQLNLLDTGMTPCHIVQSFLSELRLLPGIVASTDFPESSARTVTDFRSPARSTVLVDSARCMEPVYRGMA